MGLAHMLGLGLGLEVRVRGRGWDRCLKMVLAKLTVLPTVNSC